MSHLIDAAKESRLRALRAALEHDEHGAEPRPRLLNEFFKDLRNPDQMPFIRLQHIWCTVQMHCGASKQEAYKCFSKKDGGIWSDIREESIRLWKRSDASYEEYQTVLMRHWLREKYVASGGNLDGDLGDAPEPRFWRAGPAALRDMPEPEVAASSGIVGLQERICSRDAALGQLGHAAKKLEARFGEELEFVMRFLHGCKEPRDACRLPLEQIIAEVRGGGRATDATIGDDAIRAALRGMQAILQKYELRQAEHKVWLRQKEQISPAFRDNRACMEAQAWEACQFYYEMVEYEALLLKLVDGCVNPYEGLDGREEIVLFNARAHWLSLIGRCSQMVRELSAVLSNSTRQLRSKRLAQETKKGGLHARFVANPATHWLSAADALDRVAAMSTSHFPWALDELVEIMDMLRRFPAMPLSKLLQVLPPSHVDGRLNVATQCAQQLVDYLPVMAIHLYASDTARIETPKQTHILALEAIDGEGLPYVLSLMSHDSVRPDETTNLDVDDIDVVDGSSDDDAEMEVVDGSCDLGSRRTPGRPRLDDAKCYGSAFRDAIHEFIESRGQQSIDGSRKRFSEDVFGAPLSAIRDALQKVGMSASKSGIHNMLPPPAKNRLHISEGGTCTQRGAVSCKLVTVVRGEKLWHWMSEFSAAAQKYLKQTITLLESHGAETGVAAADRFRNIPLWIAATSGAHPHGYMVSRQSTEPGFMVLDHDFPIEKRMTLSTSGVHVLKPQTLFPGEVLIDAEKPQLPVAKEGEVTVFLRANRYTPPGAMTNMSDFLTVVAMDKQLRVAEVLHLTTDNASDYTVDSSFNQHCLGLPFLEGRVMVVVTSHAPGHSSWHVEGEKPWTEIQPLLRGQHFGRPNDVESHPFLDSDIEKGCLDICEKGLSQYARLLATKLKRFNVRVPGKGEQSTVPDGDLIKAFHADDKWDHVLDARFERQREQFEVLMQHCLKLNSFLVYKMCTRDEDISACAHCRGVIERKQLSHPGWHPCKVLKPLEVNDFWPFLPVLPSEMDDAFSQTTVGGSDGAPKQFQVSSREVTRPATFAPKPARNQYVSFLSMLARGVRQTKVVVPVCTETKRFAGVITCPEPGCRYVAKTQSELKRHARHGHCCGADGSETDEEQSAEAAQVAVGEFHVDLSGLEPQVPKPRTTKRKADLLEFEDEEADMQHEAAPAASAASGSAAGSSAAPRTVPLGTDIDIETMGFLAPKSKTARVHVQRAGLVPMCHKAETAIELKSGTVLLCGFPEYFATYPYRAICEKCYSPGVMSDKSRELILTMIEQHCGVVCDA